MLNVSEDGNVSEVFFMRGLSIHHHDSGQHLAFRACPLYSTHIYPLKITVRNSRWNNGIIGVDYRNYVHPQQLMECAV